MFQNTDLGKSEIRNLSVLVVLAASNYFQSRQGIASSDNFLLLFVAQAISSAQSALRFAQRR